MTGSRGLVERRGGGMRTRHRPVNPSTTEGQIEVLATAISSEISSSDIASHVAQADPHAQYQQESEKDQASGYAALTAGRVVAENRIDAAIARVAGVVTSLAGTANQIAASAATGAVTVSLPSGGTLPGSWTAQTGLQVNGILSVQEPAVRTFTVINAQATVNGNGAIAFALSFQPTFDSSVTALGVGAWINTTTLNSVFTQATMQGIRITMAKGASATVTVATGLYVGDVNFGGTNYAIYTELGRVRLGDVIETAAAQESTGAGSALLGANCPAVTVGAPFKWIKVRTSDGSTAYYPVWK